MKKLALTILPLLFLALPLMSQDIFTDELDGISLTYKYSGGNAYHVKMEEGILSYQFLTGPKPDVWWGPFPYKAVKTQNGEYLVSWFEKGYGDYITLLINFDGKYLFGTGVIYGKKGVFTHFEKAIINTVEPVTGN